MASQLTRVLVTSRVTLSHVFQVDGVAGDAAGNVTVTVKRLDGTVITTGTAAQGTPADGIYTFVLPESAVLDTYTVDWVGVFGGATVTARDWVEVVGGFMFGLNEAASMPPALDLVKWPYSTLAEKRTEVEQIAERIAGVAFVPRFKRVALSGNGRPSLATPFVELRAVRAIRVNGTDWDAGAVAAVGASTSGVLTLTPGLANWGAVWPVGVGNVIVELEHGYDLPPEEVRTAGKLHLRHRLTLSNTGTPYRAVSFTLADGGVYRMSTPAKDRTGIPEVDAAYLGQQIGGGGFA